MILNTYFYELYLANLPLYYPFTFVGFHMGNLVLAAYPNYFHMKKHVKLDVDIPSHIIYFLIVSR